MKPLISVIIPVYNAEAYIQRVIESVKLQGFNDFELILINDGSTDNSPEMCDSYARDDSRIFTFHQSNKGVSSARNKGLDEAHGDYVVFLDADDELMENSLKTMYDQIIENQCDIFIGQKMVVQLNGNITSFTYPNSNSIWKGTEGIEMSLNDHPACYSSCGKIYKSSIVKDVRFVVGKRIHEDSFFIFECMLKKPKVVVKDICVFKVHYTVGSASRGEFSKKYFDMMYFFERKKEYIECLYPEFLNKIPNLAIKVNMAMLHALSNQINLRYLKQELKCIELIRSNKKCFSAAINEDAKWFKIIYCICIFHIKLFT